MHEVHKRVHDPQVVKHLPGRNHRSKSGTSARLLCSGTDFHILIWGGWKNIWGGAFSSKLIQLRLNSIYNSAHPPHPPQKSEIDLSCPRVGCLFMTFCLIAWDLSSATQWGRWPGALLTIWQHCIPLQFTHRCDCGITLSVYPHWQAEKSA